MTTGEGGVGVGAGGKPVVKGGEMNGGDNSNAQAVVEPMDTTAPPASNPIDDDDLHDGIVAK